MWSIFDSNEEENEDRSHQDGNKQFCIFCNEETEFLWDRCAICKNN